MHDEFKTLRKFDAGKGREGFLYSLPALEEQGIERISRLPVSIRIVLESVLRNCDGKKVRRKDVETLANWNAKSPANAEIPFVVARIVLQDFTGVPLVVDLAAMRSAVKLLGGDPKIIEPLVPVDLVVDHSVQVDFFGSARALELNLEMEFKRNRERYQFLKWGQQAFKTFQLIPPGIGIVHQVNLEYLAKGVLFSQPSTLNSQLSSGRALRQFLRLFARLFDRADHVEGLLRQVVVLAFEYLREAPNCFANWHRLAFAASEALRDVEGL